MAVPTHFKIVFRGEFVNTPEEWSFSTKWNRDVEAGQDATVDNISESAINTACQTFFSHSRFPNTVRLTEWRAYVIDTTGHMQGNPKIVELPVGSQPRGTSTSAWYPPQVALCVTTEGAQRGPARLGRFYLPTPADTLASDLRLSVGSAVGWVDATVAFLKGISDAIDLPDTIGSAEMLNISAVGAGARQNVRNIRIGRALDHVHRRRRAMVEEPQVSGTIDW